MGDQTMKVATSRSSDANGVADGAEKAITTRERGMEAARLAKEDWE
jgi:hypothetical protein